MKNIIQVIQSLTGNVHPPTEHSKNVAIPPCKVFRNRNDINNNDNNVYLLLYNVMLIYLIFSSKLS
jgi:hypothetical protein